MVRPCRRATMVAPALAAFDGTTRRTRAVLVACVCQAAAKVVAEAAPPGLGSVIWRAVIKAARSGSAGFVAGTIQVLAFMWLRTAMNYQYKFGGSLVEVLKKLYAEGGVGRLYKGLFPWAIFQAPLSRFGDVAANDLVLGVTGALLPQVPVPVATFVASMAGAAWRVAITPIDTCKTILQTDGAKGWNLLIGKVKEGGVVVLWSGWEGNYVANVVGNYPWFATMNWLSKRIPVPEGNVMKLVRSAFLGAASSSVSDVISNSIRVVKTRKQTHSNSNVDYVTCATEIVQADGLQGLFLRGLETRVFTNILQGAFFTILWKSIAGTR